MSICYLSSSSLSAGIPAILSSAADTIFDWVSPTRKQDIYNARAEFKAFCLPINIKAHATMLAGDRRGSPCKQQLIIGVCQRPVIKRGLLVDWWPIAGFPASLAFADTTWPIVSQRVISNCLINFILWVFSFILFLVLYPLYIFFSLISSSACL